MLKTIAILSVSIKFFTTFVENLFGMKKLLIVLFLIISCCTQIMSAQTDFSPVKELARRLAPVYADRIVFNHIADADTADVYQYQQHGDTLVISANSVNAAAVGLGHYLKYYCNANISWFKDDPIVLPRQMPVVEGVVKNAALVKNRFFLNYCTFGYTMPWWQWDDWERLIDWMAIHGVNLPLAITGQEAVWRNVWQKLGLDAKEIDAYFTGPAHLPWHRMSNMDAFQGNLPQSWHKHQAALQQKIVSRERQLGMRPVLPAFAGHVPQALARKYPDAKITRMSQWGGFKDQYRSFFLDPADTLFPKIQKLFLNEQTKLYGTDHIYGLDPFNEVDPPSWEPDFLAQTGKYIYGTLAQADPDAVWLQMTWLFYYASKKWQPDRIKAFITAVPHDKLILLDYYCDRAEVWKCTDAYYGQQYIWCYLGNFGGNTMIAGNIKDTRTKIDNVMLHGGNNFSGIGSTLEGMDVNPLMYEYVFESAWSGMPGDSLWINAYADRRAGAPNATLRHAWQNMYNYIYNRYATSGQATLTNSRPAMKGHGRYTKTVYDYDNAKLHAVWQEMIKGAGKTPGNAVTFDIVNVGRQVMGNTFGMLRDSLTAAYEKGDAQSVHRYGDTMLELLNDMDALLSCHSSFLMGRWDAAAAEFGQTAAEKEYYRTNARTILTTWGEAGQSLNDYANRSWAGLTALYYKPRWQMFINDIYAAMDNGTPFDSDAFKTKCLAFETDFATGSGANNVYRTEPNNGSIISLAQRLASKYAPENIK